MEAAITVDTVEVRDKSKSMTKTERNVESRSEIYPVDSLPKQSTDSLHHLNE